MDRFICGLTVIELQTIQNAGKFSTLDELLEIVKNEKISSEFNQLNLKIDKNVNNQNEQITLDVVESDPVCLCHHSC